VGRILIRGGCVLTLGEKSPNYPSADILIDDGVVSAVGSGLDARGAEVIDASDSIVMPGFIDAHRHTWRALLRNLGTTASVDPSHLQPDDVYAGTLIGLLGAVESGITTVVDWADLPDEEQYVDAALQAHADAGLRTVFVHAPSGGAGRDGRSQLRRIAGTDLPSRTSVAVGSADVARSSTDRIEADWAFGRDLGLRIHAHAGLAPSEAGVVADLATRGLIGDDLTLVHGTHLSDGDLDAVAEHHASVVVAPAAEMAGDLGVPPLQKLLDRDIQPGLATNDERIASGDMLTQMRTANSVQHAAYFDLKLAGKAGLPNLLTTRDMIRYATLEGARSVGLATTTGSLEPGKQADLIVLRTDRPNIYPINDPIGAVVWGVDASNIDWVFVGGQALMREGRLDADIGELHRIGSAARDRVAASAGLLAETGGGEAG
jgi:5-methylthioadenosine/S-adenosylhomocysteine deaminase